MPALTFFPLLTHLLLFANKCILKNGQGVGKQPCSSLKGAVSLPYFLCIWKTEIQRCAGKCLPISYLDEDEEKGKESPSLQYFTSSWDISTPTLADLKPPNWGHFASSCELVQAGSSRASQLLSLTLWMTSTTGPEDQHQIQDQSPLPVPVLSKYKWCWEQRSAPFHPHPQPASHICSHICTHIFFSGWMTEHLNNEYGTLYITHLCKANFTTESN